MRKFAPMISKGAIQLTRASWGWIDDFTDCDGMGPPSSKKEVNHGLLTRSTLRDPSLGAPLHGPVDADPTSRELPELVAHAEDEAAAAAVLSEGIDEPSLAVDALDDGGVMSGVKSADPDVAKLDDVPRLHVRIRPDVDSAPVLNPDDEDRSAPDVVAAIGVVRPRAWPRSRGLQSLEGEPGTFAIADALAQVSEAERNNPVAQGRSKSRGRSWSKDQYQA